MRNNYTCTTTYSGSAIFAFMLIVCLTLSFQLLKAQTLYKAVSASQLDMASISSNAQSGEQIISEGSYLIKDGVLDEIYNMKLMFLDSSIVNQKITFEKTRVMVLPIMSMVHIVGTIDVNGIKSTTSFQLAFIINADQSISFKGTKVFKLEDFVKELPSNELKLDIDFVLKNNKNDLAILTAK